MKYSIIALGACLTAFSNAVTMTNYTPTSDVDAGFESYLKALYASAEDAAATTTFTDYFTTTGQLIVLANTATGADEIVALKQELLPPAGYKHWDHHPGATSVDSDTTDSRTYLVEGVIQTTFDEGNCSQAVYSTRFTVGKEDGTVQLVAHNGYLVTYDDFVVDPSTSPTDIPCS